MSTNRHPRHIEVPHTTNFRDIGGYRTRDGKRVTMFKHFYRSDQLGCVTAEGAKTMTTKLKIKYAIDLRSNEEAKESPYDLAGIERVAIPIRPKSFFEFVGTRETLNEQGALDLVTYVGTSFLLDFREEMKQFFDLLLTKVRGTPAVVHCTAGKDRTGLATALLLYALDVPDETIRADFLLSNEYLPVRAVACVVANCQLSPEAAGVLLRAQAEFFDAAIAAVKAQYGSVGEYLHKGLELTPAKRELLKTFYTRESSGRR